MRRLGDAYRLRFRSCWCERRERGLGRRGLEDARDTLQQQRDERAAHTGGGEGGVDDGGVELEEYGLQQLEREALQARRAAVHQLEDAPKHLQERRGRVGAAET